MTFTLALPVWLTHLMRPKAASSPPFDMLAAQRLDILLAPNDGLHIVAGEVVLQRAARWIGDATIQPAALRLHEGSGWTSIERERVTLIASRTSRVVKIVH